MSQTEMHEIDLQALAGPVKAVERFGLEGPVKQWRALRETIHADICRNGFSAERNAFVQCYGSNDLDASLLMMPLVGFLPATDPRVVGTVEAIARELAVDGVVFRYSENSDVDGLPHGEGAFLACSFWLADNLAMMGRHEDARRLFEQLLSLRNDLGLLAEEYDPVGKRQLGNFPQTDGHQEESFPKRAAVRRPELARFRQACSMQASHGNPLPREEQ